MDSQSRRAREVQSAIRHILVNQWDPIGITDDPIARGEYDHYIGGVYRLLAEGASPNDVANHLSAVQEKAMGISRNPTDLRAVAEALCALDVRLGGAPSDSRAQIDGGQPSLHHPHTNPTRPARRAPGR